jgi:hypothetical protein
MLRSTTELGIRTEKTGKQSSEIVELRTGRIAESEENRTQINFGHVADCCHFDTVCFHRQIRGKGATPKRPCLMIFRWILSIIKKMTKSVMLSFREIV